MGRGIAGRIRGVVRPAAVLAAALAIAACDPVVVQPPPPAVTPAPQSKRASRLNEPCGWRMSTLSIVTPHAPVGAAHQRF
mgnify:CR=1 FL=1